ncbi:hypothetical protein [Herbaspirillum huttiense]|uniref:hypothetical protein n=1 Tax=Herbaspirillum huttiense TaxID=863372 RepID=UPI0031D044CB
MKMGIQTGQKYLVNHQRKGVFYMKLESINGKWVTGVVVEPEKDQAIGDEITVRIDFCSFCVVEQ